MIPGGSPAAPWGILVVGRDFVFIAVARVKLRSAARERTRAPNWHTTSATYTPQPSNLASVASFSSIFLLSVTILIDFRQIFDRFSIDFR